MFHNLFFEPDVAGQQKNFFNQSTNISYSKRIRDISKRKYLLLPGILWKVGEKGEMKAINSSQGERGTYLKKG